MCYCYHAYNPIPPFASASPPLAARVLALASIESPKLLTCSFSLSSSILGAKVGSRRPERLVHADSAIEARDSRGWTSHVFVWRNWRH